MINPMRRVTIPVPQEKWEDSLRFYQQVLGMEVFYEADFGTSAQAAMLGLAGPLDAHLTVMRYPGSEIGMVGLMNYRQPQVVAPVLGKPEGKPFPIYFVCSAQNAAEVHARALAFGSKVLRPPTVTQPFGGPSTRMMICLDPNGIYVELMESPINDTAPGRVGPLRRVTVAVPSGMMDEAMEFYSHVMGLKPLIDRESAGTAEKSALGVGDFRLRIVSLQQGDVDHGMVGLMEYYEPQLDVRPLARAAGEPFPVTFIFLTDDVQAVLARVKEKGAPIVSPPLTFEIPGRGLATEMTCLDPLGVLLTFTQLPAGS